MKELFKLSFKISLSTVSVLFLGQFITRSVNFGITRAVEIYKGDPEKFLYERSLTKNLAAGVGALLAGIVGICALASYTVPIPRMNPNVIYTNPSMLLLTAVMSMIGYMVANTLNKEGITKITAKNLLWNRVYSYMNCTYKDAMKTVDVMILDRSYLPPFASAFMAGTFIGVSKLMER